MIFEVIQSCTDKHVSGINFVFRTSIKTAARTLVALQTAPSQRQHPDFFRAHCSSSCFVVLSTTEFPTGALMVSIIH